MSAPRHWVLVRISPLLFPLSFSNKYLLVTNVLGFYYYLLWSRLLQRRWQHHTHYSHSRNFPRRSRGIAGFALFFDGSVFDACDGNLLCQCDDWCGKSVSLYDECEDSESYVKGIDGLSCSERKNIMLDRDGCRQGEGQGREEMGERRNKKPYLVYTQYPLMQMTMRIRCNRTCSHLYSMIISHPSLQSST